MVFARSPISSPPRVWLNPRSIATLLVHRPTAKMNDTEVERQIHQMVSFIKQEAEEKADRAKVRPALGGDDDGAPGECAQQ